MPSHDAGWEGEISLDLDAVSALCPNCHILLVEANASYTTDLNQAVATAAALGANQISNSWSGEDTFPPGDVYSTHGVPIVFATGDFGYNSTLYNGYTLNSYPASLPGVIAAGGTSVAAASSGVGGRGFAEAAWATKAGEAATSGCNTYETKPSYQLDTGCTGRSYADISADADPATGLLVYDTGSGGWVQYGGTSLATPLISAYYAIAGISNPSPSWAYANSALLNDPVGGIVGTCPASIAYICTAGTGYDGPTGIGSISGDVTAGAPGIGGPTFPTTSGSANTYTQSVSTSSATREGRDLPELP